jgi:hypothetical protein
MGKRILVLFIKLRKSKYPITELKTDESFAVLLRMDFGRMGIFLLLNPFRLKKKYCKARKIEGLRMPVNQHVRRGCATKQRAEFAAL